jgi:TusE/DsrC/DsvC family sulfur relay protein
MAIEIAGRTLTTDNEGYLLEPSDWNDDVAQEIARREGLPLSDERWMVVRFVRDYFETRHSVPEARHALKAMQIHLGTDKATRKYLYQLFPYGYGQQACKIAGVRKPLKLMLDV